MDHVHVVNVNVSTLSISQRKTVLKWSPVITKIICLGKLKNIKNLFFNRKTFNLIYLRITSLLILFNIRDQRIMILYRLLFFLINHRLIILILLEENLKLLYLKNLDMLLIFQIGR